MESSHHRLPSRRVPTGAHRRLCPLRRRLGGYHHVHQYLAREIGLYGIRANCVAPGFIQTGRLAPIFAEMGPDLLETVSLRRFGTPDDCAGIIEFLATDLGAYASGAVIPVDGGTA
ncbi:MAG: 3-oxoacyl-ACP reductase [Bradyrhizobium sp.]|nr:3-oxoacyl-ACP reductase [Bradyrhizobium sp.]